MDNEQTVITCSHVLLFCLCIEHGRNIDHPVVDLLYTTTFARVRQFRVV